MTRSACGTAAAVPEVCEPLPESDASVPCIPAALKGRGMAAQNKRQSTNANAGEKRVWFFLFFIAIQSSMDKFRYLTFIIIYAGMPGKKNLPNVSYYKSKMIESAQFLAE